MAVKGPAYVKTTWAFEERPVASSKLNTWDDRIESALELVFFLLTQAWGGGSGVLRGATTYNLATHALDPPGMSVEVQAGYAFINGFPFKLAEPIETVDVAAPTTHDRIDLVQAGLETWTVSIKTGIEAETPTERTPDEDCIALAHLYLRPGMSTIKNSDDGTNGYIIDARAFV